MFNNKFKKIILILVAFTLVLLVASSQGMPFEIFEPPEAVETGGTNVELAPDGKPDKPPYTIALDAGHGGIDGGADEYVLEKDITDLTIKYLEEFLTNDENFTPVLCKPYGDGANVTQRAEVAQQANANLLISVHGNTDPTRTATGFECFPAPPGRIYHEQSLKFAQIVAKRMGEAGQRLRGERGVRYKYYEELLNGKTKEIIAEESDKTVYEAISFRMVEQTDCPSVLVEQCFLTSKSDVAKWASDEGCKNAAQIYYEAICEYFGTEAKI